MKELNGLRGAAQHLCNTIFLSPWHAPISDDLYRIMLECPVRYKPSGNDILHSQLVPMEGALSHVEGIVLYALARAINAQRIVELGTFAGHSTNYLAEAARRTGGRVDTVDLVWYWGGVFRGQAITLGNRRVVRQHKSDAFDYLLDDIVFTDKLNIKHEINMASLDFIFEDTNHWYDDTMALIALSVIKLKSGGILAIHDVAVTEVEGCEVHGAVKDSGLPFECFTVWPGQQGLAVWRKP